MLKGDYLIVGAGAAGPVLAARLSEDPSVNVILLEAGEENTMDVGRMQGAFFYTWSSPINWGYKTTRQAELRGRQIDEPRGRVMGGSTAINVGAWMRGCAADYDAWEHQGASGWSWQAALSVFKRVEDTERGPSMWRGRGGPIRLVDLPTPTSLSDTLLNAFTEAGFGPRGDVNGETPLVADRYQTIFPDRVRCTPADAYLDASVRARPNLTVVTGALVTRVLFEGKRAVGVEYERDGRVHQAAAAREVVLCAGAINTPQLLLLSGIGPAAHLRDHDIPLVAESPGVGRNLQEHIAVQIRALAREGVSGSYPGWPGEADMAQWRKDRSGLAAYWQQNGAGYIKIDAAAPGPDFELLFQYNPDPSHPFFTRVPDAAARSGYTITVILLQPRSRGVIQLASRDPHDHPVIDPAFLSDPRDLSDLIKGVRAAQSLTRTPSLAPYSELVFPEHAASDAELAEFIRDDAGIAFHPVGTARMGSVSDPMTVVDPQLKVKGVQGLRVADASIFPTIIRGHTMAPTVFVGERAAELIRSKS